MTARLRELAERWKSQTKTHNSPRTLRKCADELLAILDAEGEGGAVRDGWKLGIAVLQSDLYGRLSEEDRAVCDALIQENPYINTTRRHPTRSGGVSDADVSVVAKMIADRVGNGMREKYQDLAKQILEHFAKGERHG